MEQNTPRNDLRTLRNGRQGQPVGTPPASANQEVPNGAENSEMTNPLWMLVPWAVFALAAGVKFWRLTALFRRNLLGVPTKTERFRQALERMWQKDQQAA